MRGSPWHRLLSALLAIWFGVFFAEPAWLHACPVHAPGGEHGAAPAAGTAAGEAVGDAAHHAAMGHDAPAPADAGHQCSCPGACCAVSAPALPVVTEQPILDALVAVTDPGRPAHEYVAAWVDFVLPFATAPPRPAVPA